MNKVVCDLLCFLHWCHLSSVGPAKRQLCALRLAFVLWGKQGSTTAASSSSRHNSHWDRRPSALTAALSLQRSQCRILFGTLLQHFSRWLIFLSDLALCSRRNLPSLHFCDCRGRPSAARVQTVRCIATIIYKLLRLYVCVTIFRVMSTYECLLKLDRTTLQSQSPLARTCVDSVAFCLELQIRPPSQMGQLTRAF